MFNAKIDLCPMNYPTRYAVTAEAQSSGIRVTIADSDAPFADLDKDTASVSKEITWASYNEDGMTAVRNMAYALAAKLLHNQFGAQK